MNAPLFLDLFLNLPWAWSWALHLGFELKVNVQDPGWSSWAPRGQTKGGSVSKRGEEWGCQWQVITWGCSSAVGKIQVHLVLFLKANFLLTYGTEAAETGPKSPRNSVVGLVEKISWKRMGSHLSPAEEGGHVQIPVSESKGRALLCAVPSPISSVVPSSSSYVQQCLSFTRFQKRPDLRSAWLLNIPEEMFHLRKAVLKPWRCVWVGAHRGEQGGHQLPSESHNRERDQRSNVAGERGEDRGR